LIASNLCEPEIGFNGVTGYIYASVMDAISDTNLDRKDRTTLMQIGRLQYLEDKDFVRIGADKLDVSDQTKILFGGTTLLKGKNERDDRN
jgi:hypothetical protein